MATDDIMTTGRRRARSETSDGNAAFPGTPTLAQRIASLKAAQSGHSAERRKPPSGGTPLVMPTTPRTLRHSFSGIEFPKTPEEKSILSRPQQNLKAMVDWPDTESWAHWSAANGSQAGDTSTNIANNALFDSTSDDENSPDKQNQPRTPIMTLIQGRQPKLVFGKGETEGRGVNSRTHPMSQRIVDEKDKETSPTSSFVNKKINNFVTKVSYLSPPHHASKEEVEDIRQIQVMVSSSFGDKTKSNSFDSSENDSSEEGRHKVNVDFSASNIRQVAKAGGLPLDVIDRILSEAGSSSTASTSPSSFVSVEKDPTIDLTSSSSSSTFSPKARDSENVRSCLNGSDSSSSSSSSIDNATGSPPQTSKTNNLPWMYSDARSIPIAMPRAYSKSEDFAFPPAANERKSVGNTSRLLSSPPWLRSNYKSPYQRTLEPVAGHSVSGEGTAIGPLGQSDQFGMSGSRIASNNPLRSRVEMPGFPPQNHRQDPSYPYFGQTGNGRLGIDRRVDLFHPSWVEMREPSLSLSEDSEADQVVFLGTKQGQTESRENQVKPSKVKPDTEFSPRAKTIKWEDRSEVQREMWTLDDRCDSVSCGDSNPRTERQDPDGSSHSEHYESVILPTELEGQKMNEWKNISRRTKSGSTYSDFSRENASIDRLLSLLEPMVKVEQGNVDSGGPKRPGRFYLDDDHISLLQERFSVTASDDSSESTQTSQSFSMSSFLKDNDSDVIEMISRTKFGTRRTLNQPAVMAVKRRIIAEDPPQGDSSLAESRSASKSASFDDGSIQYSLGTSLMRNTREGQIENEDTRDPPQYEVTKIAETKKREPEGFGLGPNAMIRPSRKEPEGATSEVFVNDDASDVFRNVDEEPSLGRRSVSFVGAEIRSQASESFPSPPKALPPKTPRAPEDSNYNECTVPAELSFPETKETTSSFHLWDTESEAGTIPTVQAVHQGRRSKGTEKKQKTKLPPVKSSKAQHSQTNETSNSSAIQGAFGNLLYGKRKDKPRASTDEKSNQVRRYWQSFSSVKTAGSFDSVSIGNEPRGTLRAGPSPLYHTQTIHRQAPHPIPKKEGKTRLANKRENELKDDIPPPVPREITKPSAGEMAKPVADRVLYVMGPLLSDDSEDLDTQLTEDEPSEKGAGQEEQGCSFMCGDSDWFKTFSGLC